MGQKVNPIIFRQGFGKPNVSLWFANDNKYPQLLYQDLEIRQFLSNLLKSRGIFLRSCKVYRSNSTIHVDLDLYFSHMLAKQAKFLWAKRFFSSLKKKYVSLNRIRDLKTFLASLEKKVSFKQSQLSLPKARKVRKISLPSQANLKKDNLLLDYKKRFSFFIVLKEKRRIFLRKKKKLALLSFVKRSFIPKFIRIKLFRLDKLFTLQKTNYRFGEFFTQNIRINVRKGLKSYFPILSKSLASSLSKFTGVENIKIDMRSTQLLFVPSLKLYHQFLVKELSLFQRNKSIGPFFYETIEVLYFVLGTFSYGNAALIASLLSFLLENSRKHVFVIRFLKKALYILFHKLPTNYLAINGLKILVKGRFNKRRRTKTLIIQEGQIASQTLDTPLDYTQSKAVTLYGSFGIKVWLSKKKD